MRPVIEQVFEDLTQRRSLMDGEDLTLEIAQLGLAVVAVLVKKDISFQDKTRDLVPIGHVDGDSAEADLGMGLDDFIHCHLLL